MGRRRAREKSLRCEADVGTIAVSWRTGAGKALERQFAVFVPQSAANLE